MQVNLTQVINPKLVKKHRQLKTSRQTELWYAKELLKLTKELIREIEEALNKPTQTLVNDAPSTAEALSVRAVIKQLEKIKNKDIEAKANSIAVDFANRANKQNHREVSRNLLKQTGADLAEILLYSEGVKNTFEALVRYNVQLIKSIRETYLTKIESIVSQGVLSGKLTRDIAAEIKQAGKTSVKKALLIARDQSAKANSSLTRARHEQVGIKKYKWSTSKDERVRQSHAENEGKIFSYNKPPPTGNPGDEINCRCVAIPYFSDLKEFKKR